MELFLLIRTQFINHKVHFQENKNWNKSKKKRELYQLDTIYSAVNVRLKTSNNKHLIDLILNSPRIKMSEQKNILLDHPDTKKIGCRLFVGAEAKKYRFSRYLLYHFGSNSIST